MTEPGPWYQGTDHPTHQDGCLMCAVRALTEGDPAATWNPQVTGSTISGVVLRQGEVATNFGPVPFVDLWQGGTGRVRVLAHQSSLRHALAGAAALVGDRLQIRYDGERIMETGRFPGKPFKIWTVEIQRGH